MSVEISQRVSRARGWLGQSSLEQAVTAAVWVASITYMVGVLAHWWPTDVVSYPIHYVATMVRDTAWSRSQ